MVTTDAESGWFFVEGSMSVDLLCNQLVDTSRQIEKQLVDR